jgi:hypothetical protein
VRLRVGPLLLALLLGLALGAFLTWVGHRAGWLGSQPGPTSEEPPLVATAFFARFSPETAAAQARPDVRWNVLWDHQRDTWLFDKANQTRRRGAAIRYWVVRNESKQLVAPEELEALNERLFQAIVEGVKKEGAEVFDSAAKWKSGTETIVQPLDAEGKPRVRMFFGSQVCYRTPQVEGRVFASVMGDGAGAVTVCVTLIEQPAVSHPARPRRP